MEAAACEGGSQLFLRIGPLAVVLLEAGVALPLLQKAGEEHVHPAEAGMVGVLPDVGPVRAGDGEGVVAQNGGQLVGGGHVEEEHAAGLQGLPDGLKEVLDPVHKIVHPVAGRDHRVHGLVEGDAPHILADEGQKPQPCVEGLLPSPHEHVLGQVRPGDMIALAGQAHRQTPGAAGAFEDAFRPRLPQKAVDIVGPAVVVHIRHHAVVARGKGAVRFVHINPFSRSWAYSTSRVSRWFMPDFLISAMSASSCKLASG